ncbi:expressed unknown protein [Seminavis robusta]|uniref:Uncharacterized protein n=1 Tax=Seminavis robusta TaxID=568900 RepID=A0A9N8ESJ9_9STRA|nr:expressed unknown protein [Seminavis robusta]|eukprot:Sro1982_g309170.1 n/a (167) ;mRNA; f:689-1189
MIRAKLLPLLSLLVCLSLSSVHCFTTAGRRCHTRKLPLTSSSLEATRSQVLCAVSAAWWMLLSSPASALPQSYSTNARNLDRLSVGDSSGGSVYDNNPSQPAARRRRAMQGCKIPSARAQAASLSGGKGSLSEKECNIQVMQESPDFMLQALQELECSTCPYGVRQ